MNKLEFLNTLEKYLKCIEKQDRDKFIRYYEEMIEDYKEDGCKEVDAIKKVGDPRDIANTILSEQDDVISKVPSTGSKVINKVLLILGFPLWGSLALSAILFILSACIVIWSFPFVTGVSAISFFVGSLFSILGAPFVMLETIPVGIVQLGLGIAFMGLSILLALITTYLYKKLVDIMKTFKSKLGRVISEKVVKIWE